MEEKRRKKSRLKYAISTQVRNAKAREYNAMGTRTVFMEKAITVA